MPLPVVASEHLKTGARDGPLQDLAPKSLAVSGPFRVLQVRLRRTLPREVHVEFLHLTGGRERGRGFSVSVSFLFSRPRLLLQPTAYLLMRHEMKTCGPLTALSFFCAVSMSSRRETRRKGKKMARRKGRKGGQKKGKGCSSFSWVFGPLRRIHGTLTSPISSHLNLNVSLICAEASISEDID